MRKIVQHSFLGGQLDFEMMGRQDVEKYSKGATLLKNFIPLKRGALRKRPGTDLVAGMSIGTNSGNIRNGHYRLVPFAYTADEGWTLLFTDGSISAFSRGDPDAADAQGRRVRTGTVHKDADAAWFTGAQVEEFDWCQCGDVMFIAHRTHPPCRIEHTVSAGVHTFTLKNMDFNRQARGVPTITGATVSKQAVTDEGGVVTEQYVATAVYDGVESFHSPIYAQGGASDGCKAAYRAFLKQLAYWSAMPSLQAYVGAAEYIPPTANYSSTSYHAPWTQSQTIKLQISTPTGQDEQVETVRSLEQLRIYRKSGGLFGLVGTVDVNLTIGAAGSVSGPTFGCDHGQLPASVPAGNPATAAENAAAYAEYATVEKPSSGRAVNLTLASKATAVDVYVWPGHVTETQNEDGEGNLTGITLAYVPFQSTKYTIRLGTTSKTVTGPFQTAKTVTYNLGAGEDEDTLRARAWSAFCASLVPIKTSLSRSSASDSVDIEPYWTKVPTPTEGGTKCVTISAVAIKATNSGGSSAVGSSWTDRYYTPDVSITPPKRKEVMNGPGDYPGCVCVSQQRLIWAGTANEPARVMMSQVGDFYTYAPHEVMVDDDPIDFMVSATRFPEINHIVELRKLLMFNGDAEWVVDSASAASGITWQTIQARQHSSIGAAPRLKPLVCNNVLLFAERTGRAVRQYGYQLEDDGYGGLDVSIFASSIFRDRRIVDWTYQQHPHSTCWCVLDDGTLASLTFIPEQNAVAWATHELGGGGKARAICCTHALEGNDTSQVFVLVQRNATWTLEAFRRDCRHGSDGRADTLCMDCVRETADGAWSGMTTVVSGGVSRSGYTFESRFQSVHPVVAEREGMAQMDVRCVQSVRLRLADAVGGKVWAEGVPEASASLLVKTAAPVPASSGDVALPTVDEIVPLVTADTRDGRINVSQREPWPFTVLMLETDVEMETGGDR